MKNDVKIINRNEVPPVIIKDSDSIRLKSIKEGLIPIQFKGYNTEYYEKILAMNAATFQSMANIRWKFVASAFPKTVLDYGCGSNMFGIHRPDGIIVDSYDIGKIGDAPYPQSGICHPKYDLITFWDVLEHVDWANEPDKYILEWMGKSRFVAATIPILQSGNGYRLEDWKHYKPGEHLTYFSIKSFVEFMSKNGFTTDSHGTPECPPRTDIHSFLFRRKD